MLIIGEVRDGKNEWSVSIRSREMCIKKLQNVEFTIEKLITELKVVRVVCP